MLRPCGVELARRWVAALLVVDESEREALVSAVERQVVATYGISRDYSEPNEETRSLEMTVVHEPVQKAQYVEHIEVSYSGPAPQPAKRVPKASSNKGPKRKPGARRA